MTVKTIVHPETGRTYRLGRNRPTGHHPKVRLDKFLSLSTLPTAPATAHYSRAAAAALREGYVNDELGCCVVSCIAHLEGVLVGNSGAMPPIYTRPQIVRAYSDIGGYDESQTDANGNNPTDGGCDEQTALNYWRDHGFHGRKIAGWVSVTPELAKTACWLFEALMFGLQMPDKWINPAPEATGFEWGVAGDPNPENGHCVAGVEYNLNGIGVPTWGLIGWLDDKAVQKYASGSGGGELYAVISQEVLNRATKKAPSGFDWEQLVTHFNALGGKLALPGAA